MKNKHDAKVRKSSLVNFQIGLIASLLFTYLIFEVSTAEPVVTISTPVQEFPEETNFSIDQFKVEKPKPQKVVKKSTKPKMANLTKIKPVSNDTEIEKFEVDLEKNVASKSKPVQVSEIDDVKDVENITYPFEALENVPVFPGCEKMKTNKERVTCFNEKVRKIVLRKFNTNLGSQYGLKGVQKIYTEFEVSKEGVIQNVRVRGPHPRLEKEANRVIHLIPQMKPGMQRLQPVTVKYQLPIVFQVQD